MTKNIVKYLAISTLLVFGYNTLAKAEVNFQKVYELDGSASNIIANFSRVALQHKNINGDALTAKVEVRCLNSEAMLGGIIPASYSKYWGDLLVEAKDGRYRLTYSNMKYRSDNEVNRMMDGWSMTMFSKLDCTAGFEELALDLKNRTKNFSNSW